MDAQSGQSDVDAEWEEFEQEVLLGDDHSGPTSPPMSSDAGSLDGDHSAGAQFSVSWWAPLIKSHLQKFGIPRQNRPLLVASSCCGCCAEAECLKAGL